MGCGEIVMSKVFYKQCQLTKGTSSEVAFIPEKFAVLNKYLSIDKEEGPDNGWQVTRVGGTRVDGAYLKEHERNYLSQREASDI